MKGLIYFIICCFLTINIMVSHSQYSSQNNNTIAKFQQNIKKIKIAVKEMTCQKGCADGIDKKLKGVSGIIRSKTKLETGIATVTYDDTKISPNEIIKIIEAQGYPATLTKT